MLFKITKDEIDFVTLRKDLQAPSSGGYVSFEGWVRNHHEGKDVEKLVYSAYEEMANQIGSDIIRDALELYHINNAVCVHRVGELHVGDVAVVVAVSAAHRGDAFKACKYIIDTIKKDVPIWKHEFYVDGTDAWTLNHHCG